MAAGPNVTELAEAMRDEGKENFYIRLVALHAGRLVNMENLRQKTNFDRGYDSGFVSCMAEFLNGLFNESGTGDDGAHVVQTDLTRMLAAVRKDREIRAAALV